MWHVGETLKERGHQITFISMDTIKGREICSKLFEENGVNFKLTKCMEKGKTDGFEGFGLQLDDWKHGCIETIKQLQPDLIIADFFSIGIGADELGIPFVLNAAHPMSFLFNMGVGSTIDINRASNCCGCLCVF